MGGALTAVRTWLASHWRDALLASASIALAYLALEIGYRAYQYRTLPDRLFAIVAAQLSGGPSTRDQFMFDPHTGYRYTPNFDGVRGAPWYSRWRTNSHGHVSQFEYPQRRPPGEYRIAVVGDSLTANITNNVRWTELVEERLNAAPAWRAAVGGHFTRVINFGVDGMGMVQFGAMVRYHVMDFEPDLVIVNFIADDILRRVRYPQMPYATPDRDEAIRAYVRTNFLDRINWFRVFPELFAATVGRAWNMASALPLDPRVILASQPDFKYARRADAIAASAAAVRDILAQARNVVFLEMPQVQELEGYEHPDWIGLVADLRQAVPNLPFVSMRPAMEALLDGKRFKDRPDLAGMTRARIIALPEPQRLELYRWFYLPEDTHYTDYGTTLYAGEVAKFLIAHAGAWPAGGD
jgi:hypothetical protein